MGHAYYVMYFDIQNSIYSYKKRKKEVIMFINGFIKMTHKLNKCDILNLRTIKMYTYLVYRIYDLSGKKTI